MDVDQRVTYTHRILRGAVLKKYMVVLFECKQLGKDLVGDKCTLVNLKGLYIEDFWTWDTSDGVGYDGDAYLVLEKCVEFEKELWSELGKLIWRKHRSVFQDHLKYIHNDIVKPFRVGILHYVESVE